MKVRYHRKIKEKSIKSYLAQRLVTFVVLVIMIHSVTLVILFYKDYKDNLIKNTENISYQIAFTLNTYFDSINQDVDLLAANHNIIKMFKNDRDESAMALYKQKEEIIKSLQTFKSHREDVENVMVFYKDRRINIYDNTTSSYYSPKFLSYLDKKLDSYIYRKIHYLELGEYYGKFYVLMPISDISSMDGKIIGGLLIEFNNKVIEKIINEQVISKETSILLSNNQLELYHSSSKDSLLKLYKKYNGEKGYYFHQYNHKQYLVFTSEIKSNNWVLSIHRPLTEIRKIIFNSFSIVCLLTVTIIGIIILYSRALAKSLVNPITELTKSLKLTQKGKYEILDKNESIYQEVNYINQTFNEMIIELNHLINDNLKLGLLKKSAEFEALQAKLNPHFLYNTFQSINSLVILERYDEISNVTNSLSDMLEYTLYEENQEVKLNKELEYIDRYVYLQNIRYSGSVNYECISHINAEEIILPKLFLQPIVENAVVHGINNSTKNKHYIKVELTEKNFEIKIIVEDNGIGMSVEKLEQVNKMIREKTRYKECGIGLINTYERMILRYGNTCSMELDSKKGEGTKVIIKIKRGNQ